MQVLETLQGGFFESGIARQDNCMMGCIHPKSNLRQEGEGPLVSSEVGTGTQEPWYQPIVKGRYQFHIFSLSHPLVPVCPVTQ